MICPEEGLLQRYIDNEIDFEEKKYIENHLLNCEYCSTVYKELKDADDFTSDLMNRYKQYAEQNYPSARTKAVKSKYPGYGYGYGIAHNEKKERIGEYFMQYLYKYRKIAAGMCIALLAVVCVNVFPVSAAVTNFLSIFRAENISGINLSARDIQEIQEELTSNKSEIDLKKFGKLEKVGGAQQPATISEAENFTDFPVLQPSDATTSNLEITNVNPQVMNFTLNVDYVNEALKTFGSTELLPEAIDQKTFALNISRRVSMKYHVKDEDIYIVQTKTPELIVPEGVDADEIYNSLRNLPIIPEDLQRQLESINDWKNTIYIPVTGTDTKEVDINGSKGYTGSKANEEGKTYSAVVWSNNGIIRTIEGNISGDEIIEIARSMK